MVKKNKIKTKNANTVKKLSKTKKKESLNQILKKMAKHAEENKNKKICDRTDISGKPFGFHKKICKTFKRFANTNPNNKKTKSFCKKHVQNDKNNKLPDMSKKGSKEWENLSKSEQKKRKKMMLMMRKMFMENQYDECIKIVNEEKPNQ